MSADCCSLAQNLTRRPVLGRAVEKLVSKQKALKKEQALAKKSSEQASAVEKPLSSGRTANPRPDAPADKPLDSATNIVGEEDRTGQGREKA